MLSSRSSLGSTNGNDPLQPPRLMGVSNVRERVVSLSMSLPRHERLRSGSNMASSANLLGSTTSSRHLVEPGEWWGVPALLERQPGPAIVKPLTGHHDVPKLSSCFVKTWSDMESAIRPPVDRHVFDGVQRRRAQLERQISRQELACHEQRLQTAKLQQSQKLERQRHVSMREQVPSAASLDLHPSMKSTASATGSAPRSGAMASAVRPTAQGSSAAAPTSRRLTRLVVGISRRRRSAQRGPRSRHGRTKPGGRPYKARQTSLLSKTSGHNKDSERPY